MSLPVRTHDPDTSVEAAERAVMKGSKIRPIIFSLVREHGPITHDELTDLYRDGVRDRGFPMASDSGIRTRLSELVAGGLVTKLPERGRSRFGNPALLWVVADPSDQPFARPDARKKD